MESKKQNPSSADELSFEQILSRLGHLVEQLERGDMPLEESLKVFEEGVTLSRLGTQRLDDAERRVEYLLARDDNAPADEGAKL